MIASLSKAPNEVHARFGSDLEYNFSENAEPEPNQPNEHAHTRIIQQAFILP